MLSDRSYMRGDYKPERTSVVIWLMCGIGAGFILQLVLGSPVFRGDAPLQALHLTLANLQRGWLWSLVTYSFLHDPGNILHLVGNLFGLYFIGREILPVLGARRFLALYASCVAAGGVLWTLVQWRTGQADALLGASAGVLGMLIVFACFFPNRTMNLLLFFVFPVSIKPKHLALGLLGFDVLGFLLYEIQGGGRSMIANVAYSAHLGGMAAGWIYFRYFHEAQWRLPGRRTATESQRGQHKARKAVATAMAQDRSRTPVHPDMRAEVDRILDKINSEGFGALSAEEKKLLDQAKDMLSKR